ncbi:tyrosine-type recombinase/integrase [Aquibacillus sp. 3ASR75-11]|uniref:Tyrosine-type recombinase/integrase n=1 Tax=Terrihalobacillus insolitus TaxID=2950438 RepID=A0A9X4AQB8_9BACI|nr:tyrosine-type recombinase/integrase [Terrihalobacillus insolitus]MDC3426370.1 tyrosine-type recombinase/integrase [Terrihalobacillus insolitus]
MELSGINAYLIDQYIAFKRNMGYALSSTSNFKTFDDFTIKNDANSVGLTRELADKWIEIRSNESEVTRYKRVNDIRNFCIYLNQLGYQSYIPRLPKKYQSTFTPYIFSEKRLKSFFTACDTIRVKDNTSNMKFILPVVFRLIYGCGLRINEALSLKNKDVNLEEGYIIVRETKNGSDRILPLSDSLITIGKQYKKMIHLSVNESDDYFFIQKNGDRYASDTVYRWFRKILWEAGISHGGKGLGPRVHDLRHSFSVHSLAEMSRKGLDLYYSLPILSKYLGHNSLEATDKYVRLTSDMYPELIEDVNKLCSYLFPEVKQNETY